VPCRKNGSAQYYHTAYCFQVVIDDKETFILVDYFRFTKVLAIENMKEEIIDCDLHNRKF